MAAFWDPRFLLNVYPTRSDFSCTGTTIEGKRCCQKTCIDHKHQSEQILAALGRKDVVTTGLNGPMKRQILLLAELTLCLRWHRYGDHSQIDVLYDEWTEIIRAFCVEEKMKRDLFLEQTQRRAPDAAIAHRRAIQQPRDVSVPLNIKLPH